MWTMVDVRTHAANVAVEADVVQTRIFSSHVPRVFDRLLWEVYASVQDVLMPEKKRMIKK